MKMTHKYAPSHVPKLIVERYFFAWQQ